MKYLSFILFALSMIMISSYGMEKGNEDNVSNTQKNNILSLQALALTELIIDHAQKINTMQETVAQEMLTTTESQLEYKIPEDFRLCYLPEVARTYYFLFNKYFDVGRNYGFSIGELIAYGRIQTVLGALFARACYHKNSFVIKKNYHINSLAGLESIPFKHYITECVIQYNMLSTLSSHFSSLSALEALNMSHNRISSIEDNALRGLKHLTILNLSHNKLQHIKEHFFVGCNGLVILNLNDNAIDVIETGAFAHLKDLNILNLINNQLSVVPQELFKVAQLQILMLGENSIPESQREDLEQALENTSISWQKRSESCNSRTYIRTMHDDTT